LGKNEIRVQYSGFIIFTAQILSIITGLAFTLLLTRSMNTSEYGVWTNIFDYTGYFLLFSGLIPFWATRFVARGQEGAIKTSTAANFILALASMAIYFPVITLITQAVGTQAYLPIYLIAALYIFNTFMLLNLEGCLRAVRPQAIGYGLLIEEVVKVTVAFVIIVGLGQLFLGAILSLTLSALIQIVYYVRLLAGEFKQKIRWRYLKEWFKGSAVILYNAAGLQLLAFVFILLFYFGGSDARAYYQAAFTFSNIIMYAASLAFALYPKLLAKDCPDEQVGSSFRLVMMFAIPLAAITIAMSASFLTVLNLAYSVAWPVLIMLTIDTLVVLVSQFYSSYLMGAEAFDAEGKIPFRQLFRTKIFKVFSLTFIQSAIALPLVYFVLTEMQSAGSVQLVVYVVAINIGVHVSTLFGLYFFMRNSARIPVDWRSMAKYVAAALVMALALYLSPYSSTLLLTIAKTAIGMGIYIGLLLVIDKQARGLLKLIIEEIKGTLQQFLPKKNR
jgi:O-antigen/teichoic acid export membrane protein